MFKKRLNKTLGLCVIYLFMCMGHTHVAIAKTTQGIDITEDSMTESHAMNSKCQIETLIVPTKFSPITSDNLMYVKASENWVFDIPLENCTSKRITFFDDNVYVYGKYDNFYLIAYEFQQKLNYGWIKAETLALNQQLPIYPKAPIRLEDFSIASFRDIHIQSGLYQQDLYKQLAEESKKLNTEKVCHSRVQIKPASDNSAFDFDRLNEILLNLGFTSNLKLTNKVILEALNCINTSDADEDVARFNNLTIKSLNEETIFTIWAELSVRTLRGIELGSSLEDIQSMYGQLGVLSKTAEGNFQYIINHWFATLTFDLNSEQYVSKITIDIKK